MRTLLICLFAPLAYATSVLAQVPADDAIVAELRTNGAKFTTPDIILWVGEGTLSDSAADSFAEDLQMGVTEIQRILSRRLDRDRYGSEDRIHVFVADGIGVSHVYGSYAHTEHPLPYLFLDAEKVQKGESPYLHELTHILAWQFGSHSLREGLASYVEAVIRIKLGLTSKALFGATPEAIDSQAAERVTSPAAAEVLPWIGASGFAPSSVTSPNRPKVRAAYYTLSQSFVQHVIRELGLATFLEVYTSTDPPGELLRRTSRSLDDWKAHWQHYLYTVATGSRAPT
jgi:hypothetical protein